MFVLHEPGVCLGPRGLFVACGLVGGSAGLVDESEEGYPG